MHILDESLDIRQTTVKLESDLDYCIRQLSGAVRSNKASNQGGYQGEPHRSRRYEYMWMPDLIKSITAEAKKFKPTAELDRIWFNINGPGNSNSWHRHSSKELVAVIYVVTHPDSGAIEFRRDDATYSITPKPGDMLLFNGGIEHRVLENFSNIDRISIACNFKI